MGKSRKWGRRILSFVLAAGMSLASIPVYAAPPDGGLGSGESNAKLPEIQTVTSIDFSTMENLDSLPEGWKISNGSGSSELVDEAEGKALKLDILKKLVHILHPFFHKYSLLDLPHLE